MKRLFAIAFAAIAFQATVGWNTTAAGYAPQPESVAAEKARVMHIADGDVASSVSASANRDSIFARNEVASTLRGDDPEALRLELFACLLIMVIAPLGALLVIRYIDHLTTRRNAQVPNRSLPLGVPMITESPKTK